MIHENETADEKAYYSDYDEETDEELEKELPDATGKKNWPFWPSTFILKGPFWSQDRPLSSTFPFKSFDTSSSTIVL